VFFNIELDVYAQSNAESVNYFVDVTSSDFQPDSDRVSDKQWEPRTYTISIRHGEFNSEQHALCHPESQWHSERVPNADANADGQHNANHHCYCKPNADAVVYNESNANGIPMDYIKPNIYEFSDAVSQSAGDTEPHIKQIPNADCFCDANSIAAHVAQHFAEYVVCPDALDDAVCKSNDDTLRYRVSVRRAYGLPNAKRFISSKSQHDDFPSVTTSASQTVSATVTRTASQTMSASATATRSQSQSRSQMSTLSSTHTASATQTPTQTQSRSLTPTSSTSGTQSQSQTRTLSATQSPSQAQTISSTGTPSVTQSPTDTGSRSQSLTPTVSQTPSPDHHAYLLCNSLPFCDRFGLC